MTTGKITAVHVDSAQVSYILGDEKQAGWRTFRSFKRSQVGGPMGYVDTIVGTRHNGSQMEWPMYLVSYETEPLNAEFP